VGHANASARVDSDEERQELACENAQVDDLVPLANLSVTKQA
jgi:hypothetical protein